MFKHIKCALVKKRNAICLSKEVKPYNQIGKFTKNDKRISFHKHFSRENPYLTQETFKV